MAPIKFEDNIKETLSKRTIKPSSNSWNTLSDRLDAHDKKKPNKVFWYIGIAASVIGILLIGNGLFFNSLNPVSTNQNVVDVEAENNEVIENNTIKPNDNKSNKDVKSDEKTRIENQVEIKIASQSQSSYKNNSSNSKIKTSQQLVAQKENTLDKSKHQKSEQEELIVNSNVFEEIKTDAIAETPQSDAVKSKVLDVEIESLLNEAQQNVTANNTTNKVDANSLLQDVEADLDQSFRDKVFESLKKNYKIVKTAVADRNN